VYLDGSPAVGRTKAKTHVEPVRPRLCDTQKKIHTTHTHTHTHTHIHRAEHPYPRGNKRPGAGHGCISVVCFTVLCKVGLEKLGVQCHHNFTECTVAHWIGRTPYHAWKAIGDVFGSRVTTWSRTVCHPSHTCKHKLHTDITDLRYFGINNLTIEYRCASPDVRTMSVIDPKHGRVGVLAAGQLQQARVIVLRGEA
jgi:hypothetical protein